MCATSEVVVVLPWVPLTTMLWRPASSCSPSTAGNEVSVRPRSRAAATSTWSREWVLPTTTRSGCQSRLDGENPSNTGIFSAASWSLIGGYSAVSEPRTSWPAAQSRPATAPMPVPPIPMRWTFTARGTYTLGRGR